MKNYKPSILVAVLLKRTKVANNPWITEKWQAQGVVPMGKAPNNLTAPELVSTRTDYAIYRYNNLILSFEYDELESYYQNLVADKASIFIICHEDASGAPMPFLVTLSYDEAAIYMETDELVYATGIDINIYKQIEVFVLENYQPERRKKRKLKMGGASASYEQKNKYE